MDIKEKIEELWEKITADDGILEQFKEAPVQTVEKLLGIDLPDEKLREIVTAIKAKVDMDAIDAKLDVLADQLDDKLDALKTRVDMDAVDDKLDVLADKLEDKLGSLFGKKAAVVVQVIYVVLMVAGGYVGFDALIPFTDLFCALEIFINMTGLVLMFGVIRSTTKDYFDKLPSRK